MPACTNPSRQPQPLHPGQVVAVDVALSPSATLFRAGQQLRLLVAGRWLVSRNPLSGQFPAAYPRPRVDTSPCAGVRTMTHVPEIPTVC